MATSTIDPQSEADRLASTFEERLEQLRSDLGDSVAETDDPQAKALFETASETLGGLQKAFEHFQAKTEEAWRPSSPVLPS